MFLTMQLDDTILKTIEISPDEELKESRDLIMRIRRRDLYQVEKLSNSLIVPNNKSQLIDKFSVAVL